MSTTVVENCRYFKCGNNDKGKCKISKINLQNAGSLTGGHLICTEAYREPEEPIIDRAGKEGGPT